MIRFTGEYRDDQVHVWNYFRPNRRFDCWMNNRRYTFDNLGEGKAFYEFWNKKVMTNYGKQ